MAFLSMLVTTTALLCPLPARAVSQYWMILVAVWNFLLELLQSITFSRVWKERGEGVRSKKMYFSLPYRGFLSLLFIQSFSVLQHNSPSPLSPFFLLLKEEREEEGEIFVNKDLTKQKSCFPSQFWHCNSEPQRCSVFYLLERRRWLCR